MKNPLDKLKEIAQAANKYSNEIPDPNDGPVCVSCGDTYCCDDGMDPSEVCHNCAQEYFTAMHPVKVLALLELVDQIKSRTFDYLGFLTDVCQEKESALLAKISAALGDV